MYTRENYQKIKERIESKRQKAESDADMRRAELGALSPEIKAIDEEMRGVGLEIFRTACAGGDIGAIREKNLALGKRRREIITSLGLPEDYDEPKYSCPLCSDSGFVGTKLCSCFREALTIENIASSGMGRLIERQSFENFDLSSYPEDSDDRRRAEINLKVAKSFAESFGRAPANLLFVGNTGTGKTHVSTAIAKVVITKGFDVFYDSVQNIISDFEADKFKSGYSASYEPKADKYLECDLLIIDDLGTEFVNQFTVSCLYNLINTRQNRGLSTIISTNLTPQDLKAKYDGRIISRLLGQDYTLLQFTGKDHRIF
jgi:DNA replication protein DnaC